MADFDIDVLIDERIVTSETDADKVVDAHPWVAEARALPSKMVAPPLSEMEQVMAKADVPAYRTMLTQRTKLAQLDVIDKTLAKMPKPEDLATAHPAAVEPEVTYADQLAMSNLYSMLNLGLHSVVADKLEATLNQVARDPYPSPKLAIFREMLPLSRVLEVQKADGQPDYDAMTRLRLVALRGADLLRTQRDVVLERASQALEIERYRLESMRAAVEEHGDWHAEKNVRKSMPAVMPVASERRMLAEARQKNREWNKQSDAARAQARAAGVTVAE